MEKLEQNKKRLGQKSSLGFYKYSQDGRKTEFDGSIYSELGLPAPTNPLSIAECIERCVFSMINECALALDADRIVETPHEVDLAMIMGTGFPPFRGGLLKYADSVGAVYIVDQLNKYSAERKANRLKPSSKMMERAKSQATFYKQQESQ